MSEGEGDRQGQLPKGNAPGVFFCAQAALWVNFAHVETDMAHQGCFAAIGAMFIYEYALAAVLITTPARDIPAEFMPPWHEPWRAILIDAAVKMELLDAREAPTILVDRHALLQDLELIHARFEELKHAPLIEECRRFPRRDLINDFLAFNRAYRSDLSEQMALDRLHAEELRGAIHETDQLYHIWTAVRDARSEFYYVPVRRRALLSVRRLVGDEAFYSGRLPPHVPTWRFPPLVNGR